MLDNTLRGTRTLRPVWSASSGLESGLVDASSRTRRTSGGECKQTQQTLKQERGKQETKETKENKKAITNQEKSRKGHPSFPMSKKQERTRKGHPKKQERATQFLISAKRFF
ncbi:hypothetical protein [Planctomycetes bacterium CA13]|uniref:hypothetical protein n=1 Tax=Novipirellula herctigrandis TaxID=2527986 RepID=UPI0011B68A87